MTAARAEQARLKAARPAPPPLATVAPQGTNIRREWVAQPKVETTEDEAATAEVAINRPPAAEAEYLTAPFDDESAPWPTDAVEAGLASLPTMAGEEPVRGALPALDVLTARLGADTRSLLDELFRARFVSVKRIQKSWLKD